MLHVFYGIGLSAIALLAFPKMLYQMFFHGKYRESFLKRFGKGFPDVRKKQGKVVWIHAVSVGEVKAVAALAKKFIDQDSTVTLLVSTITETGQAEARRSIPFAHYHVYFPFDWCWVVRPIVKRCKPDLVILSESDFWLNFLNESKKQGALVVLINGKVSLRSLSRFRMFSFFAKALFDKIDLLCVQSSHYRERFQQIGIPAKKLVVTGNSKFDQEVPVLSPQECQDWKAKLGIKPDSEVIVFGSTHDPEEKLIVEALKEMWSACPTLQVLLVPRHPERFDHVADLLKEASMPFYRYTQMNAGQEKAKVILVDAMGVLRKCYQIADMAVVCGSFTEKVGGHNILEPSFYGVPVIYGPHMHQQPELHELMIQSGAGKQIKNADLRNVLEGLLHNKTERERMGQAGRKLADEMKGATERIWKHL
jgi:3-deoxy-D-manno-octulosonic-acid transferase